jgi:DNA-binding response OmpR family regulator
MSADGDNVAKILVIEDDLDLARVIVNGLTQERHTVEAVHSGDDGLEMLELNQFDVVVLDWELPQMTGIELLQRYRSTGGNAPVIMLTGKSQIADKQKGLDTGADDYLTKPFDIRELAARIRAMLRRAGNEKSDILKAGDLTLDPVKYKVLKGDREIKLSPRDFSLLEFLMRHPDQVFSSDTLLGRVWNYDSDASPEGLRAAVRRIRKAVDEGDDLATSIIQNVARVGYRLRG